jgi:hypothetical protein
VRAVQQTEAPILHAVRAALLSDGRVMLWRNNTGGELVTPERGSRRFIKYGLGRGSADLVGLLRPSGRFCAFEVKAPKGRVSHEQELWGAAVQRAGGFYAIVRSVDDALAALARALEEAAA